MVAFVLYVNIPVSFFDENADVFVAEVPSDVVIIFFVLGGFDRQRKISAAQPGTLITQNLSLFRHFYILQILYTSQYKSYKLYAIRILTSRNVNQPNDKNTNTNYPSGQ